MVILGSLRDSYFINRDGSTKSAVQLSAPDDMDDYARRATSAVVADQLYLFGGWRGLRKVIFTFYFQFFYNFFKIARLDSCAFVELSVQLNNDFRDGHAALAIEDGSKGISLFLIEVLNFLSTCLFRIQSSSKLLQCVRRLNCRLNLLISLQPF